MLKDLATDPTKEVDGYFLAWRRDVKIVAVAVDDSFIPSRSYLDAKIVMDDGMDDSRDDSAVFN